MKKLLKEPLFHFLLVGAFFFLIYQVANSNASEEDRTIIVDKESLLTFLQFRNQAFNPELFEKRLAQMPQPEYDQLVQDYIREEALYREAKAMGMDQSDYVIKRRMIQKVEFISEEIAEASVQVSEDSLKQFFQENQEDYFIEPYITFTHVYFSKEKNEERALKRAERELGNLNRRQVPFEKATSRGERFVYNTNYVDRTQDYVASHFSTAFADKVFQLQPSKSKWQGPLESAYGYHLVMVTRKDTGRYPELEEVKQRVLADYEYLTKKEKQQQNLEAILDRYEIKVEYEPGGESEE